MAAKGKRSRGQILLRMAFVAYVVWMLWLLFGQRLGTEIYSQELARSMNLQPLATIKHFLKLLESDSPGLVTHAKINLAGNVVLFLPPGWLLPHIWKRYQNFFRFFFTCLGAILAIEVTQLLTLLGSFDVDDVILNMTALVIGYLAYILTHLKKKK